MTDSLAIAPEINGIETVLTPALLIFLDRLDQNLATTLRLLDGDPSRWRPHIKTAKLAETLNRLRQAGVTHFKCATTLELLTACQAGAKDVLVAYPCIGSRAQRVLAIAERYPETLVSVLVENREEIERWRNTPIGLFLDINPGMNRTGIGQENDGEVGALAEMISAQQTRLGGLHYYDGHHCQPDLEQRQAAAFRGYEILLHLVDALTHRSIECPEVITSGTPALPCALAFSGFRTGAFCHRISAGTVVYNDLTSLWQLPSEWGYVLAALVATTVVSKPVPGIITCDAGHKTVSADAGFPNCAVVGRPDLAPLHPSEEHLPLRAKDPLRTPRVGDVLFLAPRHVCPTVNNFDHAILVRNWQIIGVVPVTARGRENPLSECGPAGLLS